MYSYNEEKPILHPDLEQLLVLEISHWFCQFASKEEKERIASFNQIYGEAPVRYALICAYEKIALECQHSPFHASVRSNFLSYVHSTLEAIVSSPTKKMMRYAKNCILKNWAYLPSENEVEKLLHTLLIALRKKGDSEEDITNIFKKITNGVYNKYASYEDLVDDVRSYCQ